MENLPLDQNGHLFGKDVSEVGVIRIDDQVILADRCSYRCAWCNAWKSFQVTDTKVFQPEPCPVPDGATSVVDIDFPSGKIVVFDDLRRYFDVVGEEVEGYGSVLGDVRMMEAYAAQGLAWGHVGNSCPGMYRTGEGAYVIASPEYDDDKGDNVLPEGWTYVAGIITNTWAYSITDYDNHLARGGSLDTGQGTGPDVVEIPPGTYRFTHHTGEKGFDHYADGTVIFAHIERVKES